MKGPIPRPFIDDLLTKSDIVDVINTRVKLKKLAAIIKPVALSITKKRHPSRLVKRNSFIIASVVARTVMPFPF